MGSRTLYVARHAEAEGEGGAGLTEAGRRQAEALGDRLAGVGLSTVFHGPLPRAVETASIVVRRLSGSLPGAAVAPGDVTVAPAAVAPGDAGVAAAPAVVGCEEAGDYLPFAPALAGLPEPFARLVGSYSPGE